MSATRLAAWGVVRPAEVVELAATAGLPLPIAATMLEKESGGGRNVWGNDAVRGRGTLYRPGTEVTRADYERYRAALRAGTAGQQGVGPTQLTSRDYQEAADRIGGCWDWRANVTVGFRVLAGHIARYGTRGGFVAYNGGPGALSKGPTHAAQVYGDRSMGVLARWTDRLGQPLPPAPRPASPAPAPREDDDMNAEQARLLADIHTQLHGPDRARLGWDAWSGGSTGPDGPARFTPVDYLRKADQQAEDNRRDVAALRVELAGLRADLAQRPPVAPVQIDYAALARELIAAAKEG